jgi:hypothetical protein
MPASSSFAAFARAVSPAVDALVHTAAALAPPSEHADPSEALYVERSARHLRIMAAETVEDVIMCVPPTFRPALADPLRAISQETQRCIHAQATLAKWRVHEAAGTLPSHLRSSAPQVQQSAGYKDTAEAKAFQQKLRDAHEAHQKKQLTESRKAKADEVKSLNDALEAKELYKRLEPIIAARSAVLKETQKIPVFRDTRSGELHLDSFEENPVITKLCVEVMQDAVVYALRVSAIVHTQDALSKLKSDKKRSLAEATVAAAGDGNDAAMLVASGSGQANASIQSLVDKAVKAAVRQNSQRGRGGSRRGRGQAQGSAGTSGRAAEASASAQAAGSGGARGGRRGRGRGGRGGNRGGLSRVSNEAADSFRSIADFFIGAGAGAHRHVAGGTTTVRSSRTSISEASSTLTSAVNRRRQSWEGSGQGSQSAEQSTWQGINTRCTINVADIPVETQSVGGFSLHVTSESHVPPGDQWILSPISMPDQLLDMPTPSAVEYILTRTSVGLLSDLKFQHYVHQSPGVNLPQEVSFQLSVGMKYMFHRPTLNQLIKSSWNDFERRLRWRIKFMLEQQDSDKYDPDYDVRPHSTARPPILPQYIELGVMQGRDFVISHVRKQPVDNDEENYHSYAPHVGQLKKFLLDNSYIVSGTDKNLGIAVSRRTWIIEKSLDILNSRVDYRPLTHSQVNAICQEKCTSMRNLADLANEIDVFLPEGSQLSQFLRSKITTDGNLHKIPTFYGIPKIHKEPVKFRPIIPCHSAIQNPAAKYVDKKLRPIVVGSPTVIHGSKDLAIKLSNLVLVPDSRWYIVTGDVVAFYPNIPIENCLNIINQMYLEHYWAAIPDHDAPHNKKQQSLFLRALRVGNTKLVTQFQGEYYEQLRGLAMGVSDSPSLANLYGVHFEKLAGVIHHAAIPFYGRYIDDCLAIVYASSETEAVDLMKNTINFDGCVIEWGASYLSQPFLDMLLYKDTDNTLQWMPFRKARNHQERIPWISAHPYDVKRGTFYGEMSRLAVLSSKHSTYVEALRSLVNLYLHRGYPAQEVQKWLKTSGQERWIKRFNDRDRDSTNVLVLKSEYNLAWNYFSARELGDTVIGYWREWLKCADSREFRPGFPSPPLVTEKSDGNVGYHLDESWEDASGNVFGYPDLRMYQPNLFDARWLISKKRTRNFLDLSNLWKTTVLAQLEEQVLDEVDQPVITEGEGFNQMRLSDDELMQVDVPQPLQASGSDDEHIELHHRQHSPSVPESWASGAQSGWSRGANP